MGTAGTYIAKYAKVDANPFKTQAFGSKDKDVKFIRVELTAGQADNKDELAIDATPKGYEFVECELE